MIPQQLANLSDNLVLALLIWGEARGEPVEGQIAVGCVVRNRFFEKKAHSYKEIALAPLQFSCFDPSDPNLPLLLKLADNPEQTALAQAFWISDGILSGAAHDNTKGATHYLVSSLLTSNPPSWAKSQPILEVIGHHSFLKVS